MYTKTILGNYTKQETASQIILMSAQFCHTCGLSSQSQRLCRHGTHGGCNLNVVIGGWRKAEYPVSFWMPIQSKFRSLPRVILYAFLDQGEVARSNRPEISHWEHTLTETLRGSDISMSNRVNPVTIKQGTRSLLLSLELTKNRVRATNKKCAHYTY